jgi:radical SAM-linked protein
LQSALRVMEGRAPSREPACLQVLRTLMAGPSLPDLDAVYAGILNDNLVEEAGELLRALRREAGNKAGIESLASRLAPLAAKEQERRSARWQLDTRRVLIRFFYAKEGGALGFDDGDLHVIFLHAFRLEGLRLLLDLGKRPRPLLSVGLPLPVGVSSRAESMDALLRQEPEDDPVDLMTRLNHRLPEGLCIHQWMALPRYASPVSDLAILSRWRWEVAPELRPLALEKIASFLAASHWPWDRGSSFRDGPVDLRNVVSDLLWNESTLCFSTRMEGYQAINPLKMLGAILGLDVSRMVGLIRTAVDLKPDPRLEQAERFQPKLKNMYEDAVLLGGGSNIILVDEDDDDPILLR